MCFVNTPLIEYNETFKTLHGLSPRAVYFIQTGSSALSDTYIYSHIIIDLILEQYHKAKYTGNFKGIINILTQA